MDRQQPLDACHNRPRGRRQEHARHGAHPQADLALFGVLLFSIIVLISLCACPAAAQHWLQHWASACPPTIVAEIAGRCIGNPCRTDIGVWSFVPGGGA